MAEALGGYAEPSVWLVLVAMIMARVLIDTGAAHRIALLFIRQFGKHSLGVSYALVMTDVTLAGGVPSITARSAGMVMPVGKAIAELFDSHPGATAPRLGRFLFASMYQGSAVACAMFLTGQASNILGAGLAMKLVNVEITWSSWFISAIVPGIVSCIAVPWVVYRRVPPEIVATPQATEFARAQLEKLGALDRNESIALGVFASIGLLWLTSGLHGLDVTFVSLLGSGHTAADGHTGLGSGHRRAVRVGRVHLVRRTAQDGRTAQRHRRDAACSRKASAASSSACRGLRCCC